MQSLRRSSFRSLLAALPLVLLVACGGSVVVSGEGGAGGEGAGGTTGSGTSVKVCGGKQGLSCLDQTEWCNFPDNAVCGDGDQLGACQPKPEGCPADCPGVCGCDGTFYCNTCTANAAGVDVDPMATCASPPQSGEYSAEVLPTDAPRFVIFKADPVQDRCFRMMVEGFGGGQYEVQAPDGWSVGLTEVTNHASDCAVGPGGWPVMTAQSAPAAAVVGTLAFEAMPFPCTVSLHATLVFDSLLPWVPGKEPMDVDGLVVKGACP